MKSHALARRLLKMPNVSVVRDSNSDCDNGHTNIKNVNLITTNKTTPDYHYCSGEYYDSGDGKEVTVISIT